MNCKNCGKSLSITKKEAVELSRSKGLKVFYCTDECYSVFINALNKLCEKIINSVF